MSYRILKGVYVCVPREAAGQNSDRSPGLTLRLWQWSDAVLQQTSAVRHTLTDLKRPHTPKINRKRKHTYKGLRNLDRCTVMHGALAYVNQQGQREQFWRYLLFKKIKINEVIWTCSNVTFKPIEYIFAFEKVKRK